MKVYIWTPRPLSLDPGHAAISIGNQYFSFSINYANNSFNKWNTLYEDEKSHKRSADHIIEIDVDKIFHPYILDQYNPSNTITGRFSYRGMGGKPYHLVYNNCCHQVAMFTNTAIFPYLIDIFGNPQGNTYWLNYDNEHYAQARYEKLKSLYCKYNINNDKEDIIILCKWELFKMYKLALLHKYGSKVAMNILEKNYPEEQPDQVVWHPNSIIKYANYAKAVVEDFSGRVPSLPWIYTTQWANSNGAPIKAEINSVEEFQRTDIGFREQTSLNKSIDDVINTLKKYPGLILKIFNLKK
ncbi:MAG: hypothetical protein HEQ19_29825 [Gloeotrichia echinulata CP02]